jgi:mannosyltransferase
MPKDSESATEPTAFSMPGLAALRTPAARDAGVLLLLALLVTLVHLGSKSLVYDESGSAAYARLGPLALLKTIVRDDPNMSLYYVLLNCWVRIFGESDAALRVPSALCGALAVPAIYLLGRRLFGRTAGLIAGVLLALNPFMVRYAQTARAYALLVLLVTLSSYFFVRVIESPSERNRIGYAISSMLAVLAHFFAAYVLAAHFLTLVALKRRSALTREWLSVAATIVLSCALVALFAAFSRGARRIGWIQPASVADVGKVLVDLAGRNRSLLFVLLIGGCYAAAFAWRERRTWRVGFVAAWLLVPVALSFLVSLVKPMFLSRYLIICVPALILFGVAGIARLRPAAVVVAASALLAGVSAKGLVGFYAGEAPENWRDATRHVLAATHAGDGLVFVPNYAHRPFAYYARQHGLTEPPNVTGQRLANSQRIWLVTREADVAAGRTQLAQLQASLTESFRLVEARRFAGVGIALYVR